MIRKQLQRWLHMGFDSDIFVEYKAEVAAANLVSLKYLSFICMIAGIVLLIVSLFPNTDITALMPGYAVLTATMAAVFVSVFTVLKRRSTWVRYVWRFLLVGALLAGTLIGTVLQPDTSVVTMIVFVVLAPLLVIDRPVVTCGITGVMSLLFIVLTKLCKTPYLANIDVINICVFFAFGVVVDYQMVRAKMRDIVSRKLLQSQRDTDGLTGLNNRTYFEKEINRRLSAGMDNGLLIMLDIDNFKTINDMYGHDCGDLALTRIAEMLRTHFRAEDVIGRLGGDEFIVFLPSCECCDRIFDKINTLLSDIGQIRVDGTDAKCMGTSAGVARYPLDGKNFQQLYKSADHALYAAKSNGKGQYCVYSEQLESSAASDAGTSGKE